MQKILTETDLRSELIPAGTKVYPVSEDTVITPAAREYLRKRGVELKLTKASLQSGTYESMSRTRIENRGAYTHIDAESGKGYREKPEDMTHLRGNLLVKKTHPRIVFRGKLDSLEAAVLECQAMAAQAGKQKLCVQLGELLGHVRRVLGAEVKEEPLIEQPLFGYDHEQLRYVSHHVKEEMGIDHPIPDYRMGLMALKLNTVRTGIREAELAAAAAFDGESGCTRTDIIEEMNRLSSGAYILFCREAAEGRQFVE